MPVTAHALRSAYLFVLRVWNAHQNGFVFLAARTQGGRWIEKGFHVRFGRRAIETFLMEHDPTLHDLYYCPNAFRCRRRLAENALPTPYALCDIDRADPSRFQPRPTVLIETSPERYQALWRFQTAASPLKAEAVSRYLTNTYGGDRGGWSITKMLRVSGTINHKPEYDLPIVTVVKNRAIPIATWPPVDLTQKTERKDFQLDPTAQELNEVVQKYGRLLEPSKIRLMKDDRVKARDRSLIIFLIVAALYDAGASPNEIASVLWVSPYFVSKHGRSFNALRAEISRIISKLENSK